MIKVIDEVTGTGIKIEVVGRPWQYQVRVGKTGSWTVSRGRTAGQIKTGEKWGRPHYPATLAQALKIAFAEISESEGIPEDQIVMVSSDNWERLIALEEERIRLVEKIGEAYNNLIEEHGKVMAQISKEAGAEEDSDDIEDDEDDENDDENESDEKTSFPKLEERLRENGIM